MKKILFFGLVAMLAGCSRHSNVISLSPAPGEGAAVEVPGLNGGVAMIPKASAFRMSGDYADRVAVTLDGAGNLVYYPAPSDISAASRPTAIGEGWWLNRQGLGPGSVFTSWTFDEYRSLAKTPTPAEIKSAVIPGAVVTDFRRLPVSLTEASSLPAAELLRLLK